MGGGAYRLILFWGRGQFGWKLLKTYIGIKRVNEYKTSFFAQCPNNQIRIHYFLTIKIEKVIQIEELLAFVGALTIGFHETFADELFRHFGGLQTLEAEHHGVTITTTRGNL